MPDRHLGRAWVVLALALALHVADEAANDFLAIYNPNVRAIRARFPFLPLPTFTFETWLTGLILGIALLLALSPLATPHPVAAQTPDPNMEPGHLWLVHARQASYGAYK